MSTLGDVRKENVGFIILEHEIQISMTASFPVNAAPPTSLSQLSLTGKIPIRAAWIAAGVSAALVLLTFIAVVTLVCWRRGRGTPHDANIQALEDAGEQDPDSAPNNNGFAAVSYNVTPPLPPVEEDEESEGEEDAARHWSNGVVLAPESHAVVI